MEWGRGEWPPVKGQSVRLFDILVLGPAMVFAGAAATGATRGAPLLRGAALVTFVGGFGTIVYNAVNYGRVAQRIKAQQQAEQAMQLGSGYWQVEPAWGSSNAAWQRYMR
jgi:hypothetical protein